MTVRLTLVSHALTPAQVAGAFPDDEPLDGRDLRRAGLGATAGNAGPGSAAGRAESGSAGGGGFGSVAVDAESGSAGGGFGSVAVDAESGSAGGGFGSAAGRAESGSAAVRAGAVSTGGGFGSAAGRAIRGPERRCEQTAEALGLCADPAADLRDCDFGRWRGRTLADVEAEDPGGVRRWLSDPAAAPHGGEPVVDVIGRVARWLAGLPDGKVIAVTHPSVIRAAAVHALQADPATFWRFDVEPLARVALTGRSGRWNLRFGQEA